MARERRPQDGSNRPQMDYYEYKRMHEERMRRAGQSVPQAHAGSEPDAPKPEKKSLFGGVKQAVAGFGARAADDDEALDAPAPAVSIEEAVPAELDAAPVDAPQIPLPGRAELPPEGPGEEALSDLDEPDGPDELGEPDDRSDNPFADTIAGIKKMGGALKKLSGALRRRMGRPDADGQDTQGDDSVYARPETAGDEDGEALSRRARRAARQASVGLVTDAPDEAPAPDGEGAPEPEAERKRFSLFASPSRTSANQDGGDDDDIAPSGGRVRLFGRRAAQDYEEDVYEGEPGADEAGPLDPVAEAGLTKQLAEALDEEAPPRKRRRRAKPADAGSVAADEPEDGGPDRAGDLEDVDEPTQLFRPLRRRADREDEQRTRKFRPVRASDGEPGGEREADAGDEDEVARVARRRRFTISRPALDAGDDYEDEDGADEEYEDEEPARKAGRRRRFQIARPARDEDDDYDDYEDEDDEDDVPVRRYGRGGRKDGVRVYQDEDDDYDEGYEDYDEDDDDYGDDVYDEPGEPIGFGKRLLRLLKAVLVIVLVLLVAAIALRQLESNGRISLNWLRGTVGVLVPLDGVFPTPGPVPDPVEAQTPDVAEAQTPQVLPDVTPGAAEEPLPSAEPTIKPYEGISLEDVPASTARAEFIEDDGLEATE